MGTPPLLRPSPRTVLRRLNVRLKTTPASTDALFIVMRRMRTPLVVLLIVFAVDVVGLSLMPGLDAEGHPYRMTIFESFYFMTYAASTIGFGEYPYTLTTAQRMWVTFAIYTSVGSWAVALGALISLVNDRAFRHALGVQGFARQVRLLREPFLIVVGYGQMGRRIVDALDERGRRLVVIDTDDQALDELAGGRLSVDVPAVAADARDPEVLLMAGLGHPYCEGLLAMTHDDSVNLAIVMAVQLLRPEVPLYARTNRRAIADSLSEFRAEGIINPYDRYGAYLALRLHRPATYQLVTWLLAPYDAPLGTRQRSLAHGRWLAVSDDHFGEEIALDLREAGLLVDVAEDDPDAQPDLTGVVGFVAGTTDASRNLALAAHARLADPDIFLSVRAASGSSDPLLKAFAPDSVFIPAQLTAEEALARVVTPDFWTFFQYAFDQSEAWSEELLARLIARNGEGSPGSRRIAIDKENAPGVVQWLGKHALTVGDLFRDPVDREQPIAAIPLILTRQGRDTFLPADDEHLQVGDEVVLAGRYGAMDGLDDTLFHTATVEYLATGNVVPTTWIFRKLSPRVEDA